MCASRMYYSRVDACAGLACIAHSFTLTLARSIAVYKREQRVSERSELAPCSSII